MHRTKQRARRQTVIRSPRRRARAATVEFRDRAALAVLRLMASSILVGCITGKSPGLRNQIRFKNFT
jgi:hypothetical protein